MPFNEVEILKSGFTLSSFNGEHIKYCVSFETLDQFISSAPASLLAHPLCDLYFVKFLERKKVGAWHNSLPSEWDFSWDRRDRLIAPPSIQFNTFSSAYQQNSNLEGEARYGAATYFWNLIKYLAEIPELSLEQWRLSI